MNIPFTKLSPSDIARPWLQVAIFNPHAQKEITVLGLIDTGADECALPAGYANILGHNLQTGKSKEIRTGNGVTTAYAHTNQLRINDFVIQETLIDFMPNLSIPLLGTRNFLSNFVLTIDYPKKIFSLETK
ncbi:MAG: retroviral-like aspartic protease family protein [Candidatus Omnitrophica bacterium]|nr:retroviral-like aspartic protease family protein [Candidatus Omnitrophota bacterium]